MLKEFRDFISRGNVLDLAIGVVLGAAFGRIVTSFVNDVLMPPIGMLVGNVDFSNLFLSLNGQAYASLAEAEAAGAPVLKYGLFINSLLDFLIVSAAVFLVIRTIGRFRRPKTDEPTDKKCPYCLSTIPAKATRCPHCTSELKE